MTPAWHPVSAERHASRQWRRYTSYDFAAPQIVVPLVGPEIAKASLSLPVGLMAQEGGFVPVAVLGVEPGRNLYVADDGRWIGPYVPSAFRCHPFSLLTTEAGQTILCVEENSGLMPEGQIGEPFFGEGDAPSAALQTVIDFLSQIESHRVNTAGAATALHASGVLVPWDLVVDVAGQPRRLEGLFRVDEAQINALAADRLASLRDAGGLAIAYTHLLSMQHVQALQSLAQARAQAQAQGQPAATSRPLVSPDGNLDLSFLESDTLRFS